MRYKTTQAQKVSKQLVRAMKADPVFYKMVCDSIYKQQQQKPRTSEDLRRIVMAKAVERSHK